MKIYTKCADFASEFCPCILAERGQCIVCSQRHGSDFCDCSDTASYCVMQELINNGGKAKPMRPTYKCKVQTVMHFKKSVLIVRVSGEGLDTQSFQTIGGYAFVRTDDNPFFDVPISVMFTEVEVDTIGFVIIAKGVKTEPFARLKEGDTIYLRGPYYNGVIGTKHIAALRNAKSMVICRGIGFLPSLHVINKLRQQGNKVEVLVDEGPFDTDLLSLLKDFFEVEVTPMSLCDKNGELTAEAKCAISEAIANGVGIIHLGLSDYLIGRCVNYISTVNDRHIPVSCCNNAKICCGEGICGACTVNPTAQRTVHLCKEQIDIPKFYANK